MVSVLLSAHVERVSVSRMRDFLLFLPSKRILKRHLGANHTLFSISYGNFFLKGRGLWQYRYGTLKCIEIYLTINTYKGDMDLLKIVTLTL